MWPSPQCLCLIRFYCFISFQNLLTSQVEEMSKNSAIEFVQVIAASRQQFEKNSNFSISLLKTVFCIKGTTDFYFAIFYVTWKGSSFTTL